MTKEECSEAMQKLGESDRRRILGEAAVIATEIKKEFEQMTRYSAGESKQLLASVDKIFDLFGNPVPVHNRELTKERVKHQLQSV
jgi:hypothetical protein